MGFMDKAKKMAEQAQQKIEEVQKDFNEKQAAGDGGTASGPAPVDYDKHGRPMPTDNERPQGDGLAGQGHAPAPAAPTAQPADGPGRQGDPLLDAEPPKPPAPPSGGQGMSSGDPLAG
jgi:hypothetical protein